MFLNIYFDLFNQYNLQGIGVLGVIGLNILHGKGFHEYKLDSLTIR